MIQVTDHIVEGSEMVCHLCAFEQRATHRNHCHSLFAKDSRIIDSKRVALNGTGYSFRMRSYSFISFSNIVAKIGIIFETNKKTARTKLFSIFLAGIGKNVYICSRIRLINLPIDERWSIFL